MQTASQQNALEWEGGSIDDVITMLAGPALAVRVEVRTPAAGRPKKVGEIHMVAGGLHEVIAGSLRGDDAMEQLRGVSPLSFRLQPRLPNPDDGGLLIPGPGEGTLAERSPADLMRYCELYVLSCVVELWRDTDRASIQYTKGEITQSVVNGNDDSDMLPEVLNWTSGGYRLLLPELSLPAPRTPAPVLIAPAPAKAAAPAAAPAPAPAPTPAPVPVAAAPAPTQPTPAAPAAQSPGPAKTMFGYAAPGGGGPVTVQTASSAPRATLARPAPKEEQAQDQRRATASGRPIDVYDEQEPRRTTDVGVPAVDQAAMQQAAQTQAAQARSAPAKAPEAKARPEPAAPQEQAPELDTLPGRAAPQDEQRSSSSQKKKKKKSVKRREARETQQRAVSQQRSARDDRGTMTANKEPEKKEMSVTTHVMIGLGLGLGIAGVYALIKMFGN